MNRHQARICAMRILYAYDINETIINITDKEDIVNFLENISFFVNPDFRFGETEEMDKQIKYDLYNNEFVSELVLLVVNNMNKIDEVISAALTDYTIDRLSYVDRAIIRIAAAEMLHTTLPDHIIINEAIEITKEYSNLDDGTQSRFTNKLLDQISTSLGNINE